jgi:hypothetical protein
VPPDDKDGERSAYAIEHLHNEVKDYAMLDLSDRVKKAGLKTFLRQQEESKTLKDDIHIFADEMGRAKFMERLGNFDHIAGRKGLQKQQWSDFKAIDYFVKPILNYKSSPYIMLGGSERVKVGKTDFALQIAETAKKKGVKNRVACNFETDRFYEIRSRVDLEEWIEPNEYNLFLFDEARQSLYSRNAMKPEVKDFLSWGDFLGKRNTHIILITANLDTLDNELHSKATNCRIEKIEKKKAKIFFRNYGNIQLQNSNFSNPIRIKDIPPTSIEFDKDEIADFDLSKEEEEEEEEEKENLPEKQERILNYILTKLEQEGIEDIENVSIEELKDILPPQRTIARLTSVSQQLVSKFIQSIEEKRKKEALTA